VTTPAHGECCFPPDRPSWDSAVAVAGRRGQSSIVNGQTTFVNEIAPSTCLPQGASTPVVPYEGAASTPGFRVLCVPVQNLLGWGTETTLTVDVPVQLTTNLVKSAASDADTSGHAGGGGGASTMSLQMLGSAPSGEPTGDVIEAEVASGLHLVGITEANLQFTINMMAELNNKYYVMDGDRTKLEVYMLSVFIFYGVGTVLAVVVTASVANMCIRRKK